MSFDIEKFKNGKLSDRTAEVPVPALASFFGKDEKAVFTVRGLTGAELGRSNEAVSQNKNIAAIAESVVSPDEKEKIEGMRQLLGLSDDVPDDIVKRHTLLTMGSVEPEIDHTTAVKLAESFPLEFYQLTTKILELTGKGKQMGKPKGSGHKVSKPA